MLHADVVVAADAGLIRNLGRDPALISQLQFIGVRQMKIMLLCLLMSTIAALAMRPAPNAHPE
jgi:hypothetical protein